MLLAVANGVIDLRTGILRPGRPEDRINLCSPVRYDPKARCPRWKRFLREVFEGSMEIIDYVQKRAGLSATGNTSEQEIAVSCGKGSNGKGIFHNTLAEALGESLAERCELDADFAEGGGLLFEEYRRWATDRKLKEKKILSQRTFGEVMGERFSKKHHEAGARYYGLRIRPGLTTDGFNPPFSGNSYTE